MPNAMNDAIEAEVVGDDGPTVLWLHGLDGPPLDRPMIERLAVDHRVLVPTFPGFAHAPRPDHCTSVGDLAHLCLGLLEREDARDVTVIGCSFGGWVAAEMAIWRPERIGRVVFVDALGIRVGGPTDRDIADLFVLGVEDRRATLFHDPAQGGLLPAEMSDEDLLGRLRSEEATVVYGWEPYFCDPKLRHRLGSITVPSSVVWGANDRLVSPDYGRAFAEALPDSRFHVIADAGHNPHVEQPEAFLDVVGPLLGASRPTSIPTA